MQDTYRFMVFGAKSDGSAAECLSDTLDREREESVTGGAGRR